MDIVTLPPDVIGKTKSADVFIAIIFVEPKSAQWKTVSLLLGSADELIVKDNIVCAFFKREYASVATAFQILEITFKWKSCYTFLKGVPLLSYKDLRWVSCFMSSFRVEKKEAHCLSTAHIEFLHPEDPGRLKCYMVVTPCRKLPYGLGYDYRLPFSFSEQLQAQAVKSGVDMCPNYGAFEIPAPQALN